MPVDVTGVAAKAQLPARSSGMAASPDPTAGLGDAAAAVDPRVTAALPDRPRRPPARGTVVEDWIDWSARPRPTPTPTPYLARRAAGLGQVTWVAQPLTVEAQPANADGWPYVWMHVFGWRSDAFVVPPSAAGTPQDDRPGKLREDRYKPGNPLDLGFALFQNLNLDSKGALLIVLAIAFFIVYWVVAGPGTYGYLMAKGKQSLSWFFFAVAALLATAVTVGLVKLVLRGPPQVRHLSVVRVTPGQPAIVFSRFGLYIPRDGDQTISLGDTAAGQLSYLSALAEHPQQLGDNGEAPAPLDYDVPVRAAADTDAPALTVPYRSSLKKFQARWVGEVSAHIGTVGGLTLAPDAGRLPLRGTLTNETGQDLTDVYLAFHVTGDRDWMVYLPSWAKDTPVDFQRDLNKAQPPESRPAFVGTAAGLSKPGDGRVLSDELAPAGSRSDPSRNGWENLWYGGLRHAALGADDPEQDKGLALSFPILSLLDRLPPMPNVPKPNAGIYGDLSDDRTDFLPRGGRMLDAGPALVAGQLLVMASARGPLPLPVQVEGSKVTGDGTTLYQFLLPIDRGGVDRPTTRPAER